MKICILFRGEIERNCHGISNPCIHYTNWQKNIFTDLSNSGYNFDIIFITYPCNSIDILKDKLHPKEIILLPFENSSQINTFSKTNDYIQTHQSEYDRFIILRFDIIYKLNITQWNHWNSTNIILPNKDITWNETKFYNDILFIIDTPKVEDFDKAVQYMLSINNTPIQKRFCYHMGMPHHIGQYLYIHRIPFELMYDTILEGTKNHPLYILFVIMIIMILLIYEPIHLYKNIQDT